MGRSLMGGCEALLRAYVAQPSGYREHAYPEASAPYIHYACHSRTLKYCPLWA